MSLARGRRARPVTVAKAVVTSLDLRDAVKDESDSSISSEADDEEENQGSPSKQQAGKRPRHASPTSSIAKPLPSTGSAIIPHPLQEYDPLSTSFSAPATPPHASEAATSKKNSPPKALQDSVQLDLGPFEKVAPLSSMPPTPLMTGSSTTSALSGGGRGGHMSESELSAAGPERQSILKTLSSLWAFTDADLAPLEYPLGAGTHLFKDSRIIIREEEPMSIVAFTLDSPTYNERLRAAQASALQSSPSTKMNSLHERTETGQDWTIVGHSDAQEREESVLDGEGLHLQYGACIPLHRFFTFPIPSADRLHPLRTSQSCLREERTSSVGLSFWSASTTCALDAGSQVTRASSSPSLDASSGKAQVERASQLS